MNIYQKYSTVFLCACMLACLMVSSVGIAIYYIYPHRMDRVANVRLAPTPFRLSMLADFLSVKLAQRREQTVMVLGDSQFYGYHQDWRHTFPVFMAESMKGVNFINLSIVDGRWDDALFLLGLATDPNIKGVIYNVDLMHYSTKEQADFQWLSSTRSFFPLYLFDPGKAWQFIRTLDPADGRQTFDWPGVTAEQFTMKSDGPNVAKLRDVLAAFEKSGLVAVVVMAPQEISSFASHGIDPGSVLRNNAFLMTVCRQYKVTCIDMMSKLDASHFQDTIHLNTKGHRALAAVLESSLRGRIDAR
jgi:hypothetical protein